MCNLVTVSFLQGNEAWVAELDSKFYEEFAVAEKQPWVTLTTGKVAGSVRSAGGGQFGAGNVTFVTVYEAG